MVKLAHYVRDGQTRVGIVAEDRTLHDLSDCAKRFGLGGEGAFRTIDEIISDDAVDKCKEIAKRADAEEGVPVDSAELLSPILSPEKILCVAVNYKSHGREATPPPKQPYLFTKFRNALIGDRQPILLPRDSTKVDWEVELSAVIGKTGKYIPRKNAMDYVVGYTVSNDVSFRDFQIPPGWPDKPNAFGPNWLKGKGLDNAFPLGPWIVSKDEIEDPYRLGLSLKVNGDLKQNAETSDMVFRIDSLIEYISAGITLRPGDVVSTGTPAGVALFSGQPYLKSGDVVEASISRIGTLRNPVKKDSAFRP